MTTRLITAMKFAVVLLVGLNLSITAQAFVYAQSTDSICADEAVARKAFDTHPDSLTMLGLGLSLSCHGKFDAAIALFREVIQKYPDFAAGFGVYGDLGHALRKHGKANEAITAYQLAIQHHADPYSGVHQALSELLRQQGRTQEAEAVLKAMPHFDPEGV